jgi:hypothetical protein
MIQALRRHGFHTIEADHVDGLCTEEDGRPLIPVFRFSGANKDEVAALQTRLTDLVIRYYEASGLPDDDEPDTRLVVSSFDRGVDREVEFEFELLFDGASALAKLPCEFFDSHGRKIRKRYCAKVDRFTAFLERIPHVHSA